MQRERDWQAWHHDYDRPGTPLLRRLRLVQIEIARWLDAHPARPLRVVSACAGEGRDLIDVLAQRPDAGRVRALLVELDPRNAAAATARARRAGLANVEVEVADAGLVASYAGWLPADLVLLCGVFGNVPDADVSRTIRALPALVAPEGGVIWTRSRRKPDLTPSIRRWLAAAGFEETAFHAPCDALFSVGAHRRTGDARPALPTARLFAFDA